MIGRKKRRQATLFIPGDIRDYIPEDHILVRVDKILKLDWLESAVRERYCFDNGRPSIAPESALRLMLAGFFLGIVHDRKLMREAQVNLAIRWFAGFTLDDAIPNHSSLTRIRSRWGEELFRELFEKVVRQCIDAKLVDGETLHIDASLIRANVSWESLSRDYAQKTLDENREKENENESGGKEDEQDKPKKPGRPAKKKKLPKKKSKTDPDASLSTNCQTRAMIPCFKQHTAVDDANGIIVDIDVQTGDDSEGKRLSEVVERVEKRLNEKVKNLTADSGYAYGENYQFLEDRETNAIIPPQKTGRRKNEKIPLRRFKFNEQKKIIVCPARKILTPGKTDEGLYRARICDCQSCKLRKRCFGNSGKSRTVRIPKGHTALLRARRKKERGWDAENVRLAGRHRYQVEGVHGEAKSCHGLNRALRRGRVNVLVQSLITAVVINLKRLAKKPKSHRKPFSAGISTRIPSTKPYNFILRIITKFFAPTPKNYHRISGNLNLSPV